VKLQRDIFLEGEGDAWLERNREKLGRSDPVSEAIEHFDLAPTNVLEVGCANGWRLARLRDKYGCTVMGVEPSTRACIWAKELNVPVVNTTAAMLPFSFNKFDLIIYGFCLYLTDPQDWFRIAAEADLVLKPGGHLIIHDFDVRGEPFARKYEHKEGLLSYHFDFAKLWLVHPNYSAITIFHDPGETISVIRKAETTLIPERP